VTRKSGLIGIVENDCVVENSTVEPAKKAEIAGVTEVGGLLVIFYKSIAAKVFEGEGSSIIARSLVQP